MPLRTQGLLLIRLDRCYATGDQWCYFNSYYNRTTGQSFVDFPMTMVNPGDVLRLNCITKH